MLKVEDNERIFKGNIKKIVIYKETPIILLADFSEKLLRVKRKWQDIFELLNRKKLTTKNTLSGKVMIQTEEDINSFPDKS